MPARPVLIAWGVLLVTLLWTYWPTVQHLVRTWSTTDDYGHGFFVPIFAAFLLWLRQSMVDPWPSRGTWWGMGLFAVWAVARWANLYLNYERDVDTLFPLLAGMALFLGGWRALHWAWPSIVFLEFMVPLPASVAALMSQPLQRVATKTTVYVLQTINVPAIIVGGHGNVIQLSEAANRLEVENACSGLRMLMLFFAICVGASFVLQARWWEKVVILVSAVPIAILSNVARITLHGAFAEWISPQVGQWVHDKAGWFMMPLAMIVLWGEMVLISRLFVEVPSRRPLSLGEGTAALVGNGASSHGRTAGRTADQTAAMLLSPRGQPIKP
ncbi:MAG: exosortase/archaeosortase family protein [Thermoguttaceae bacterium]|jgi:exosortase